MPENFGFKYAHAYELLLGVLIRQVLRLAEYSGTRLILSCWKGSLWLITKTAWRTRGSEVSSKHSPKRRR